MVVSPLGTALSYVWTVGVSPPATYRSPPTPSIAAPTAAWCRSISETRRKKRLPTRSELERRSKFILDILDFFYYSEGGAWGLNTTVRPRSNFGVSPRGGPCKKKVTVQMTLVKHKARCNHRARERVDAQSSVSRLYARGRVKSVSHGEIGNFSWGCCQDRICCSWCCVFVEEMVFIARRGWASRGRAKEKESRGCDRGRWRRPPSLTV